MGRNRKKWTFKRFWRKFLKKISGMRTSPIIRDDRPRKSRKF